MGESKRRKELDPNYGSDISLYKEVETEVGKFLFMINKKHGKYYMGIESPLQRMLVPVKYYEEGCYGFVDVSLLDVMTKEYPEYEVNTSMDNTMFLEKVAKGTIEGVDATELGVCEQKLELFKQFKGEFMGQRTLIIKGKEYLLPNIEVLETNVSSNWKCGLLPELFSDEKADDKIKGYIFMCKNEPSLTK